MMHVAVLTISDSAWRGDREDISGPAVAARMEALGWRVRPVEVVPDEIDQISKKLKELASDPEIDAILTTGGTGVAPRDVTPEAARLVVDREIPGLGELMRQKGVKTTPRAALSRGFAGLCGRVLIVNLPGAPAGAIESLDAIVELIPHVVDLAACRTSHPAAPKPA